MSNLSLLLSRTGRDLLKGPLVKTLIVDSENKTVRQLGIFQEPRLRKLLQTDIICTCTNYQKFPGKFLLLGLRGRV
jgi:hypothetical protein